jgi:hypothetical protein
MTEEQDRAARNLLRPDNHDLFDDVSLRLDARNPSIPIDTIAADIGVTVDALCRWVIGFKEKGARRSVSQSRDFAPVRPSQGHGGSMWSDDEDRRRQRIIQKARDGARATREALGG